MRNSDLLIYYWTLTFGYHASCRFRSLTPFFSSPSVSVWLNAMYDVNIIIQSFLFSHYKWQCIVFRLCFVLRFHNTTIFNNCNQIMCKHLTRLLNTHRSTQPTSHACLYFMYSKQSQLFIIVTHESIHLRLKGVVFP